MKENNINLKSIDINSFKEQIYSHYLSIFSNEDERKTLKQLENSYIKGNIKFIQILNNDYLIGFMILNVKENSYLILDYLAILPKYRNKGYGTNAVNKLIEISSDYKGIFIEVEQDNIENSLRKKFYESVGFKQLNFDLILWDIMYKPYLFSNFDINESSVIEEVLDIYKLIYGEETVKKYCKVLNNLKFEKLNKNNLALASKIQYKIFPNATAYMVYKSSVNGKKDNYFVSYITYLNNKPIGVIGLYELPKYKDTIWLSWFGVLKEYRSMGFGKQMLDYVINISKERNKKFLRLYTYEIWNHEAQSFYQKNMDAGEYYFNENEKYKNLFNGKPKIFSISLCDEKVQPWDNKFINISEDEDCHEKSLLMMKQDGII